MGWSLRVGKAGMGWSYGMDEGWKWDGKGMDEDVGVWEG